MARKGMTHGGKGKGKGSSQPHTSQTSPMVQGGKKGGKKGKGY